MTQNSAAANGDDRRERSLWASTEDGSSGFADSEGGVTHARVSALLDDVTEGELSPDSEMGQAPGDRPTEDLHADRVDDRTDDMLPPIALTRESSPIREEAAVPAMEQIQTAESAGEESSATQSSNINIKGRSDGIAVEVGYGDWTEVLGDLDSRLSQSAGFFRGGHVALDLGARAVSREELGQIRSLLSTHEMVLSLVRTESDAAFQAALDLGLAATMDSAGMEVASARPAESNDVDHGQFVYRGNLRSGQVLRKEEDVIVLGDVNPGAEVISHGNILIWGRLNGIAHAGASGDTHRVVGALTMEPIQLRIANLVAVTANEGGRMFGRRNKRNSPAAAEVAYVDGERIVTATWETARAGGRGFRRRK